ncbi:MAG: hypothetical protein MZV64_67840 [Ignavibacteriales bacterium]|nr:hypothetical protein [Ignavibacteriales bacterium]
MAAAVILPESWLSGRPPAWAGAVDDSKTPVPRPPRGARRPPSCGRPAAWAWGWPRPTEIDELNIFRATHLAMVRAVEGLPVAPDVLLVDGFPIKDVKYRQMGIPQGDRKCRSIAAASIVAKVFRDGLMSDVRRPLRRLRPGQEQGLRNGRALSGR